MGLRLRSQIIWILFAPMSLIIFVMVYFNISILGDTLQTLTSQRAESQAMNITGWVEATITPEGMDRDYIRRFCAGNESLMAYLGDMKDVRTFRIFGRSQEPLFQWGDEKTSSAENIRILQDVLQKRITYSHLWGYRGKDDTVGEPIAHYGFLDTRFLSYEYYRPVLRVGEVVGAMHVSLQIEKMPKLLKLIAIGNMALAVIFLVTVFIAISVWSQNAINRPLQYILQAQQRLGKGDFDIQVNMDLVSANELVTIYASFNQMASELKKFQEELQRKTKTLESLNEQYRRLAERLEHEVEEKTRELREFFSLITHDLRVPLAAIQGYTDLLLKPRTGELNEKQKKFVQSIAMADRHLLNLVRNMIDSVKYDAGKISYFIEEVSLSDVLDAVKSNLHQALEEKEIVLDVEVAPLCERVMADRTKIEQVLTNLISNAITFSHPKEKILVRTKDRGSIAEVSVTDRGPGISGEFLDHIFERFTQLPVDGATSSGMGLGLHIAKKILEGHSQDIRVESAPGQGSKFVFTLAKAKGNRKAGILESAAEVKND